METLNKYKRLPEFGLNYYESLYKHNTLGDLHTYRAFDLFTLAVSAGLFKWQRTLDSEQYGQWLEAHKPLKSPLQLAEIPHKLVPTESGPIRTKQHLAYWCIRASTYLDLDRGDKHNTRWEPFEDIFGQPSRSLSRAMSAPQMNKIEYTAEIDAFFEDLEKALNTDNQ